MCAIGSREQTLNLVYLGHNKHSDRGISVHVLHNNIVDMALNVSGHFMHHIFIGIPKLKFARPLVQHKAM